MTIWDYFIGALGILGTIGIVYMVYYFEKTGTWKEVTSGKNRTYLAISSVILLIAGFGGGIIMSTYEMESPLMILVPVAIGLGTYFLVVSLHREK